MLIKTSSRVSKYMKRKAIQHTAPKPCQRYNFRQASLFFIYKCSESLSTFPSPTPRTAAVAAPDLECSLILVSKLTRVSRTSLSDGTHVGLYAPQADRADAKTSAPLRAPNVEGPSGDAVTQSDWGYREENRDRKKVTVWRCVCDDPPPPPVSKKPEVR